MSQKISQMVAAGTLVGTELVEVSQLSTAVTITAATLSAAAADNSYNDSGSGFVAAGFAVGNTVQVSGFTGNAANNIKSGTVTVLTAAKMTIGGADGDVIVDDAAGETVTITRWNTRRSALDDVVAFALSTAARAPALRYTIELLNTADSDPGAGLLKFNNATPTSATFLYIDDSTSDGIDLSAYFASLGTSGYAKVQSVGDAGEWAIFQWTAALTDGTGYWKIPVTCLAFKGTLDDNDDVLITLEGAGGGSGGNELAGLTFTSDTANQADSDPGAGLFRWNNATQSSATKLFFDNATLDAVGSAAFFATLGTDATVYLQQASDPTKWQLWEIDTATADAGYYDMAVTLLAFGGAISNTASVYCDFDKGQAAGTGQTAIQFKDEGANLGAGGTVDTVNFAGAGVTAARVGNVITVTIGGGGGALSLGLAIDLPNLPVFI